MVSQKGYFVSKVRLKYYQQHTLVTVSIISITVNSISTRKTGTDSSKYFGGNCNFLPATNGLVCHYCD